EPEHPLERSSLTPLGGSRAGTGRQRADLVETWREIGEEPDDLGRRRPERLGESLGREVAERGPDRPDDRPVRLVDPGGPRGRTKDGHGFTDGSDPRDRLVEETRDADTGRAVDQDRARPAVRRVLEGTGQRREGLVAPHEPRARVRGRHAGHSTGPRPVRWTRMTEPRRAPHPANTLNELP